MGNKLCCAARGEIDDEDLNQYNQDAIEVFTEASLLDNEENEENREGTEVIEILTKRELEKKFSARRRENPEDFDNLANYALFLIVVRGGVDAERAAKILKEAEFIVERQRKDGRLTYCVRALYYWILRNDKDNAQKYFEKALSSSQAIDATKASILSDYALFLESLGDKDEQARETFLKAQDVPDTIIDPVNLCNIAIYTYRTAPHDFSLASSRFQEALQSVNRHEWRHQGRGNFVKQSYNIFVAAYSVKLAALAVHDDRQWEEKYHKIFDKHEIHTFHDFFGYDVSLRPISTVVHQNLHFYTHFVDAPKKMDLVNEIMEAAESHAKEHPKDFRSRWRYAMMLWHCEGDNDAAASEFKSMSEDCAPQPNFHAYIDAALFYQNVDVKIAEQFFEKALNAGGHANGHCLALMSIFYHNFEKDDVKSIHWAKNAVHLDVTMESFLRKRGVRFNLHDDGTEY